jgi:predicted transcriptional regulator
MAAEIVTAQVAVERMSADEIDAALKKTYQSLRSLEAQEAGAAPEMPEATVAVEPKASIQKNKIICLECGKEFKQLSKNHLATHELTPKEYRKKHGLKTGQALTAKSLSAKRRKVAKQRGLGEKMLAARKKRGKK